jgi:hypothetical protein
MATGVEIVGAVELTIIEERLEISDKMEPVMLAGTLVGAEPVPSGTVEFPVGAGVSVVSLPVRGREERGTVV